MMVRILSRAAHAATAAALVVAMSACRDSASEASGDQSTIASMRGSHAVPDGAPAPAPFLAPGAPSELSKAESGAFGEAPTGGITRFAGTGTASAMLVRTGSVRLEVVSIDRAMQGIRELAARHGSQIGDVALGSGQHEVATATVEVRVPSARFDALVGDLPGVGKVEWLDLKAQDVGEEYVDVSARVANAKRLEARLLGLVSAPSARLADVLAVERELARVREEVERLEGRMRFLAERASIGRLSIIVHEPSPAFATRPGETPIRDAFRKAWRNFIGLLALLIAVSGVVVPIGGAAAAAWIVARRYRERRRLAAAGG
jgi:hypothetical protein